MQQAMTDLVAAQHVKNISEIENVHCRLRIRLEGTMGCSLLRFWGIRFYRFIIDI